MDAETVILALLGVVRGFDGKDRGLMSRIAQGQQHAPTCMSGLWVEAGDSLRGGQPCSERCQTARLAVEWAIAWIMERKPADQTLAEVAG